MDPPSPTKPTGSGYSIRVASRLTGISSDTLRMWERRYGFPSPARNDSGIRVYSDGEIERLVLVSRALKAGFRAGEVIHRAPGELKGLLRTSAKPRFDADPGAPTVESLLDTLARDDADALRAELKQAVATLGAHRFLMEVADPLVEGVGKAWERGQLDVRHEHLLTAALSTQLRLLLSAYEETASGAPVLLTTLPGEQHGLGIEMVALYLAVHGAVPRLLGVDTPPGQIVEAARALGAAVVGISVSAASDPATTAEYLRKILGELPEGVRVWVGGRHARDLAIEHPRLDRVITWAELDRALEQTRG
jgi:DNA-binding transcriptional MerR regulator/methylmalonyl-CoA mutase cobalamin-binding subunit